MLDTYAIVRAQAELTLNDAQYAQFVTRLKRLQEARRRNQRERNQILQDLRRLTGPLAPAPADETVVRERLQGAPRPRRARHRRDAEGLRNAGRSAGRASAGALPDLRGDNRAPQAGLAAPRSRAGEPVRAWRSVAGQCGVLTRSGGSLDRSTTAASTILTRHGIARAGPPCRIVSCLLHDSPSSWL